MGLKTTVKGALFGEPERIIRKHVHNMVDDVSSAAEERLNQTLRPRNSGSLGVYLTVGQAEARGSTPSTGNYRRNLSRFFRNQFTAIVDDGGVIYGPWLEGTSNRNKTTRFKGYAAFRKTRDFVRAKIIPEQARIHVRRMVAELNRSQ